MVVAQTIGRGIQRAYRPAKVGMLIGGLEVPHVRVHVCLVNSVFDFDYDRQNKHPILKEFDEVAAILRSSLLELGYSKTVPTVG